MAKISLPLQRPENEGRPQPFHPSLASVETASGAAGTAGVGDTGVEGSLDYHSLSERSPGGGGHAEGGEAACVGSVGAGGNCVHARLTGQRPCLAGSLSSVAYALQLLRLLDCRSSLLYDAVGMCFVLSEYKEQAASGN